MNAAHYCRASVSATAKPSATISPSTAAAATTTPSLQSCWLRPSKHVWYIWRCQLISQKPYVMAHGLFTSQKGIFTCIYLTLKRKVAFDLPRKAI